MSGINAESTSLGGGYGGWGGGGWGGIAPIGLFGVLGGEGFGRRHDNDGGHCAEKLLQMHSDSINEKFSQLNANVNQGQIQEGIRDAREGLHTAGEHARTAFNLFALRTEGHFGDLRAGQRGIEFQSALNTKDIISNQKDCCCDLKMEVSEQGRLTRDLVASLDKANLERSFRDCKDDNIVLRGKLDNDRQTHHLEHFIQLMTHKLDTQDMKIGSIVNGIGNLVGNNTNTGVQA